MNNSSRGGRLRLEALAWGGLIGPGAFIAFWAALGSNRDNYSSVNEAISRLAELGASTRPAMTAGFVIYGFGLLSYAVALRPAVPGPAPLFAGGVGLATLGVAMFPLGTRWTDSAHAVFAYSGYVCLVGVPIAVSQVMRVRGRTTLARVSTLVGGVTAGFLLASAIVGPAHGLTQRIGLTVGDAWIATSALLLLQATRRMATDLGPRVPPRR